MAKKITNESLLGQRGINLLEECVLSMGFVWHPSNQAVEAGIDGHIELRNPDSEAALNLIVGVQSKALSEFAGETTTSFTYYCKPRDIDYWLQGNLPVILVVSRPATREAYWVDVKQYFSDTAVRQAHKVVFDKVRDRLDATSRPRLFGISRPRDSGLYLAPLPKPEKLLPNLLPVLLPTAQIWTASTACREPREVFDSFRSEGSHSDGGWLLYGGQIVSFQPLDQPPWTAVCTTGTARSDPTISLAESDDPDERRLFVRLLNQCLLAKCRPLDIRFHKGRELYYFAASDKLKTKSISFQSTARHSSRTVFEAYRDKETKQIRFCRHFAFEGYFRYLGSEWYLEVTPTYHFTRDGLLPDRFAGERLKGIKRLDRNRAVYGQLLTWIDLLTRPGDLFQRAYPHLRFERPAGLLLDGGIDDDAWFSNEDPEEAAKLDKDETPSGMLFNP